MTPTTPNNRTPSQYNLPRVDEGQRNDHPDYDAIIDKMPRFNPADIPKCPTFKVVRGPVPLTRSPKFYIKDD